jgi:glycosyltransferase involved in cell wall biosynthesis
MTRDWFWLYRPQAPSPRAQSVQVVHAAHAMAARGHRVVLCVESARSRGAILEHYGLEPLPTLRLHPLPGGTLGSAAYRAAFARWVARTDGRGIALARRKKHAAEALRWFGGRFRLLVEAHEVDSLQAAERGEDPAPWRALEAEVLRGAWGLVANCEGTLELLRQAHPSLPPAIVAHNAARPGAPPAEHPRGIGVVGSTRAYKDVDTVVRAAAQVDEPVTWIGADAPVVRLRSEPPISPRDVPARLVGFRALVVPLSPGLFGERLTSPLKLWDALAAGVPIVAADTPAIRAAAEGAFVPYRPGDPESLADALRRVLTDRELRQTVLIAARQRARTWDQRAAEIEAFVDRVGA